MRILQDANDAATKRPQMTAFIPTTTAKIVAAGLILRRETAEGSRWLLMQASKHGEWGFPKGHQDVGETPMQTALRECAEECEIAIVAIEGKPLEATYRLPSGHMKSVIYYPAITSQNEVVLSSEHKACAWLHADDVIKRLPHANIILLFRAYLHGLGRE
jgi:8-oxo-dGTP pyrophosphatase MutT (NUDIX family)